MLCRAFRMSRSITPNTVPFWISCSELPLVSSAPVSRWMAWGNTVASTDGGELREQASPAISNSHLKHEDPNHPPAHEHALGVVTRRRKMARGAALALGLVVSAALLGWAFFEIR